jgi:2-polyprenyl-6-methoxyphenol hydroxylase-like FAD-dependent oxidoreductase
MSSEGFDYDVVVSGYGPSGQAAASILSRLGHRVCVFGCPRGVENTSWKISTVI